MSATISDEVLAQVEAVLPTDGDGMSRGIACKAVGEWAPGTVSHALRVLCRQGRARYSGPDCLRRYFRVSP